MNDNVTPINQAVRAAMTPPPEPVAAMPPGRPQAISPPDMEYITPDTLNAQGLIVIDAIIAETFGSWERRRTRGVWKWRQKRETNTPNSGPAPWQDRPHQFSGLQNGGIVHMLDAICTAHGWDFMLVSRQVPTTDPESVYRGYVVMIGRTEAGQFRPAHKVLSSHIELACCLALVACSGVKMVDIARELFPHGEKLVE